MQIDISFVITVYNKEKYLHSLIHSIVRQVKDFKCEFIFVDDASTDNSVKVIKDIFGSYKHLIVISNEKNMGPSIRLNQGCKAASGEYLFLMDADDILIKNGFVVMMECLKQEKADFAFGLNKVTKKPRDEVYKMELPTFGRCQSSSYPLDNVLLDKFVRMAYLIKRETYIKSGGADERIFIQDESLPLRLAYHSEKIVSLLRPAVYGPKDGKCLSKNQNQQIHDKFYAYYNFLHDFTDLTRSQKAGLYKRAISAVWKAKRIHSPFKEKKSFFFFYLKVKLFTFRAKMDMLEQYKDYIDSLENVRKIH